MTIKNFNAKYNHTLTFAHTNEMKCFYTKTHAYINNEMMYPYICNENHFILSQKIHDYASDRQEWQGANTPKANNLTIRSENLFRGQP